MGVRTPVGQGWGRDFLCSSSTSSAAVPEAWRVQAGGWHRAASCLGECWVEVVPASCGHSRWGVGLEPFLLATQPQDPCAAGGQGRQGTATNLLN